MKKLLRKKLTRFLSILFVCLFVLFLPVVGSANSDIGPAGEGMGMNQTEEPQTEEPQTEEPQTEEPQTEEPQTEEPQTEEPQTEEPQTEESQTEEPQTEEPEELEAELEVLPPVAMVMFGAMAETAITDYESLKAAIEAAGDGETITISGNIDYADNPAIIINKSLSLLADDSLGSVILTAASSRHFDIQGNVTLTFQDVVLNGNNSGGGISINPAAELTLVNALIQQCKAERGGAIYVDGGSVNISNSEINGNEAKYDGGGLYISDGALQLSNTAVENNKVYRPQQGGGYYSYGGGIALMGNSTATIGANVQINNNRSELYNNSGDYHSYGGGLYVAAAATLNFAGGSGGVSIDGNSVYKGAGAGIYYEGAVKNVFLPQGVDITNNYTDTSCDGGGIYAGDDIKLTINGANISYNRTGLGGDGGGIYAGKRVELTLNNGASIDYNHAGSFGGGINAGQDSLTVINNGVTINHNTSRSNGGGVHAEWNSSAKIESTVIMNGGEICYNTADNSNGAIYAYEIVINGGRIEYNTSAGITGAGFGTVFGKFFAMTGGSISYNNAPAISTNIYHGGPGVLCMDFKMSGGEIKNNTYTKAPGSTGSIYGGGVTIVVDALNPGFGVEMTGGEISGNSADYGGGIGYWLYSANYLNESNLIKISGGEISNNTANYGGGIYALTATEISGAALICNNTASYGGGVFGFTKGDITVSGNAVLTGNSAVGGGAISTSGNIVTINGGRISGNTAKNGGGVHAYTNGQIIMAGGLISGNTASNNGGGVYGTGAVISLKKGEISANKATNDGGGVWINDIKALTTNELTFKLNSAANGYLWTLTGDEDSLLHEQNILNTTYTSPFSNAYNNFDINFNRTDAQIVKPSAPSTVTVNYYQDTLSNAPLGNKEFNLATGAELSAPIIAAELGSGWLNLYQPQDYAEGELQQNLPITVSGQQETLAVLYIQETLPLSQNATYNVTYKANGADGGSVPVDGNSYEAGATVKVCGNSGGLTHANYSFGGWSSHANGSGTIYKENAAFTMPTADVILYAVWTPENNGGGNTKPDDKDTTEDIDTLEDETTPEGQGTLEDETTPEGQGTLEDEATPEDGGGVAEYNDDKPTPAPPIPSSGGTLRPTAKNVYELIDENGTPLGRYTLSEDGAWIYDEYVPMGNLPQTGAFGFNIILPCLFVFLLALLAFTVFVPRRAGK